jgi:CHAT domain-containing protein
MIAALIELSRFEEAFHYAQRAKARTFLDQIGNARIDPLATDDPELIEQEQALLDEIRGLEAVLSGRSSFASLDTTRGGGPHTLTNEQQTETRSRLDKAYREYDHLLARIKLTNPAYADLRAVNASTLITVQQTLPANVTLLEYYVVSDTQTLAFVVTPRQGSGQAQDDFHTIPISVTAETLNQKVDWFRQFPSLEGVPQASQDLYDLLLAPVREHIRTQSILIAPHGTLHYLPFGALHDGEHYLIEDYTIAYIPSGSVLQYVQKNAQGHKGEATLVMGNPATGNPDLAPLAYAEREAEAIAAMFETRAFVGSDATETLLWEQAAQAGIVHLAAHGAFNPAAPQFSRIYLAPDPEPENKYDGLLETREVWNLPLENADLVTLSACQTQLGDLSAGDELVGLSRAFIYAGTPSLVATLWSVDDASTQFLMERFYGYLQEGQGKAPALRQAQLDTMAEYPSPYYWAAFTLIGDMGESEQVAAASRTWLWLAGGGVLLLILIGGRIWTRKVRK